MRSASLHDDRPTSDRGQAELTAVTLRRLLPC